MSAMGQGGRNRRNHPIASLWHPDHNASSCSCPDARCRALEGPATDAIGWVCARACFRVDGRNPRCAKKSDTHLTTTLPARGPIPRGTGDTTRRRG